ncbi:hypothetical protein NX059_009451 [Plenodomus lindquistii]|nr:hypothetical protein NX059_009451 [Plenodomus lindquistii]
MLTNSTLSVHAVESGKFVAVVIQGMEQVVQAVSWPTSNHTSANSTGSNGMAPMYSNSGSVPYLRSMAGHQYPQVDTKSAYPSTWTQPYQEDNSPIEHYQLDQSPVYLPDPTPMGNSGMCEPSYRWTHPIHKQLHASGSYMDPDSTYSSQGLPYLQPSYRSTVPSSPSSSLNTLQTVLPERSQLYQCHAPGTVPTQRLLPIPQPSPAQTSRVSFDLEHDQRLRSGQAIGASTMDEKPSYAKPLLPWNNEGDVPISVSETAASEAIQTVAPAHVPSPTEGEMGFLSTPTSISTEGLASTLAPQQMQLNFHTSDLLDPMNVTSPATTYSNFRDCRSSNPPSAQMSRQSSQNKYYSFGSDSTPKRKSVVGGSLKNGTLASGHRYQPLPHSPSHSSPSEKKSRRDALSHRHSPVHCRSLKSLNSSFRV